MTDKPQNSNKDDSYTIATDLQRILGACLIGLGVLCFVLLLFIPKTGTSSFDSGEVAGVAMFFIMLGMGFFLPQLLAVPDGQGFSTMRLVVYMIVAVFVITAVKTGWNAESLADFTIDRSWVYILGLAFGSKVFQSFAESD
jgi:hypothetical protein